MNDNSKYNLTLISCFLVGAFGIHRFYNGKFKSGVGMILSTLFTCGVAGFIWSFIDLVTILKNNFKDYDGNEIKYEGKFFSNVVNIIVTVLFTISFLFWILFALLVASVDSEDVSSLSSDNTAVVEEVEKTIDEKEDITSKEEEEKNEEEFLEYKDDTAEYIYQSILHENGVIDENDIDTYSFFMFFEDNGFENTCNDLADCAYYASYQRQVNDIYYLHVNIIDLDENFEVVYWMDDTRSGDDYQEDLDGNSYSIEVSYLDGGAIEIVSNNYCCGSVNDIKTGEVIIDTNPYYEDIVSEAFDDINYQDLTDLFVNETKDIFMK